MTTQNTPLPPSPISVTVQIAADQQRAFLQLVQDFQAGKFRAGTPAIDFQGKTYPDAMRDIVRAKSTSHELRSRLVVDNGRDVVEALADAEMLHAVQAKRFGEAPQPGAKVSQGGDAIEQVGIEALQRLYKVAQGDSGQCRYIARFLLGLYNGNRFPFDLTDFRAIDDALYEDCLRVLNLDVLCRKREVHTYFEQGGKKWEAMAADWRVIDISAVKHAAKRFANEVGFSGPHANAAAELIDLVDGKREE